MNRLETNLKFFVLYGRYETLSEGQLSNIDFKNLSKHEYLTIPFIIKYQDENWDWEYLSLRFRNSEKIIELFTSLPYKNYLMDNIESFDGFTPDIYSMILDQDIIPENKLETKFITHLISNYPNIVFNNLSMEVQKKLITEDKVNTFILDET